MLAMIFADFWMSGSFPVTLVGSVPQDIYGATISIGSVVKMVGVVTAINVTDSHFGEIQITPSHPGTIGPFIPDVQTGQIPQSPNFPASNPQSASFPLGFHPKQLIVGV